MQGEPAGAVVLTQALATQASVVQATLSSHCAAVLQATHAPVPTLQNGVAPPHCASAVQLKSTMALGPPPSMTVCLAGSAGW